jgi:hypothetical protein
MPVDGDQSADAHSSAGSIASASARASGTRSRRRTRAPQRGDRVELGAVGVARRDDQLAAGARCSTPRAAQYG